MASIVDSYQNVYHASQKFPEAQKALFEALSPLYTEPVEQLSSDFYYNQAKLVNQGTVLQPYLSVLRPFAKDYLRQVEETVALIAKSVLPPKKLPGKLYDLACAHIHFINAYVPAFKSAYRETSAVISMDYPKTLQLFGRVLQDLSPQQIEEQGGPLMARLPALAIEKLIATFDPEQVPELYQAQADTLRKKSFVHQGLSQEERTNLHKFLLGEEVELQPVTQELFKTIHLIAGQIAQAKYNLILRVAFEKMNG